MKGWKIFVLAWLLYGVGVFGGFIQDDTRVIENDPQMGRVSALLASFTRPYYYMTAENAGAYRPLTSFSLYLNALITGKGAWGFRLVNIFLYAGVCLLVFEVLKMFSSGKLAFWGALIFMVLPVHTEVVNNIVGRAEMISLGFMLLAVLMQNKNRWELSAGLFFLALLSKETAMVGLPILIYLLISSKEKKDIKMGVFSFYILVILSYLILRVIVMGGALGNTASVVENPLRFVSAEQRVVNAFALIPFGVGKIIFPWNLSYDYSFSQIKLISSWFDWRVWLGICLVIFSMGSLFTSLRKNKLWILGQAFFWGPILITGNFLFPVGTIFGERLWFWPSLGMVMMGVCGVSLVRFRIKSARIILTIITVIFLGRTFLRNLDWLSEDRLFIHDVTYAKDSVMAQNNAAAMYLLRYDFIKGKEFLEKAEMIYPKYQQLMNNWGMYYLWTGDSEKAKEKFEECLKVEPVYYLCEMNIKLIK